MEKYCKAELCNGCSACANICSSGCIAMLPDEEGFLRPVIDESRCVDCGRCRQVCPVLQESVPAVGQTVACAAVNCEDAVRFDSTSGGVFTLLGQWVLDRGGVVFGAAYNDSFEVVHRKAETARELEAFRGAKYAQSRLEDVFRQVKASLEEERYVLFSGTPCQVGGLLAFLGNRQEKLILVDLICHGVPSPAVWQHYIRYRSGQDARGQNPARIHLRSKETGWPAYSVRFEYPDGRVYSAPSSRDAYLRGFVGNLYLRPSCYHCQFKGTARQSDFTLGDYWGVWNQLPEYHDGRGTSLVLLHTPKARQLWDAIAPGLRYSETGVSDAVAENPSAVESALLTEKRSAFFSRYGQEDFAALVNALLPPAPVKAPQSFLHRALRKMKRAAASVVKKIQNPS